MSEMLFRSTLYSFQLVNAYLFKTQSTRKYIYRTQSRMNQAKRHNRSLTAK